MWRVRNLIIHQHCLEAIRKLKDFQKLKKVSMHKNALIWDPTALLPLIGSKATDVCQISAGPYTVWILWSYSGWCTDLADLVVVLTRDLYEIAELLINVNSTGIKWIVAPKYGRLHYDRGRSAVPQLQSPKLLVHILTEIRFQKSTPKLRKGAEFMFDLPVEYGWRAIAGWGFCVSTYWGSTWDW